MGTRHVIPSELPPILTVLWNGRRDDPETFISSLRKMKHISRWYRNTGDDLDDSDGGLYWRTIEYVANELMHLSGCYCWDKDNFMALVEKLIPCWFPLYQFKEPGNIGSHISKKWEEMLNVPLRHSGSGWELRPLLKVVDELVKTDAPVSAGAYLLFTPVFFDYKLSWSDHKAATLIYTSVEEADRKRSKKAKAAAAPTPQQIAQQQLEDLEKFRVLTGTIVRAANTPWIQRFSIEYDPVGACPACRTRHKLTLTKSVLKAPTNKGAGKKRLALGLFCDNCGFFLNRLNHGTGTAYAVDDLVTMWNEYRMDEPHTPGTVDTLVMTQICSI